MAVLSRMLVASPEQRALLERWERATNTPQGIALSARIILRSLDGASSKQIGRDLNVSQPTIRRWQRRLRDAGPEGITEIAPGRGRKPTYGARKVQRIFAATQSTRPDAQRHWSCRSMAAEQGVSKDTVRRIWNLHGLKPHLERSFNLSLDKRFVDKLTDVVGLRLNLPDKALVLCVDEKNQIQALDRTQRGLPMKKGRCGTMTHDYVRRGTTTLFAALKVLEGTAVGEFLPWHRHQEFLKFLERLDREFPEHQALHLIVDNYATHKHARVKAWLKRHPRFHPHFTPTSSSWLNLVERWFRELTDKPIRRGVFVSVPDLIESIDAYVATHNASAKPFVWTATVEGILRKLAKVNAVYDTQD